MTEVKRRKQMHGQRSALNIGCFISECDVSEAHAVYLGIASKDNYQHHRISSHNCIFECCKILQLCQNVLEFCKFNSSQTYQQIADNFKEDLHNRYGNYPTDDAVYEIDGDEKFFEKLLRSKDAHIIELLQTEYRVFVNGDNLFNGDKVCDNFEQRKAENKTLVKIIKPPVQKKYKVFARVLKSVDIPNYSYRIPDENCVFFVGKNRNEPIVYSREKKARIFNEYVTAAVVADYASARNRSSLMEEEVERLLIEAARLGGK